MFLLCLSVHGGPSPVVPDFATRCQVRWGPIPFSSRIPKFRKYHFEKQIGGGGEEGFGVDGFGVGG